MRRPPRHPPLSLDDRRSLEFSRWEPYYPEDYPIQDGDHNPWVTVDPLSGATAYQVWLSLGRPVDEHTLRTKLNELRGQ